MSVKTAVTLRREDLTPSPAKYKRLSSVQIQLDELQLKKTLGSGSFGRVVLARHKPTGQYFALKLMPISEVIRQKQTFNVISERDILFSTKHPFIVQLFHTDHDEFILYLLFEYCAGGDIYTHLHAAGSFTPSATMFYAAQILLALEYLHSRSIVYRDLKPENVMLDRTGNVKVTDFGFAKKINGRTWTLCGTPEFIAPEVIRNEGHGFAADFWSLGVFIYEMLTGRTPFASHSALKVFENILKGNIPYWPDSAVSPAAKDLIGRMLVVDTTHRIGVLQNGVEDIKKHKWFSEMNWEDLYNRKVEPPFVPATKGPGDTTHFKSVTDTGWSPAVIQEVPVEHLETFRDF